MGGQQVLGCYAAGLLAAGLGLAACSAQQDVADRAQMVRVSLSAPVLPARPPLLERALPDLVVAGAPDSVERSRARYDAAGLALVDAQGEWRRLRARTDASPEALEAASEALRQARAALADAALDLDWARREAGTAVAKAGPPPALLAQQPERR